MMICYGESSRENGINSISVEMSFCDEDGGFFGSTGDRTLDVLLSSFCKYGHIALTVDAEEYNEYTPETVAVLMGNATRQALGERDEGCVCVNALPFGESLARVALDLSADALTAFVFDGTLADDKKYIVEFLRTYTYAMGKTLQVYIYGTAGDRHKAEAAFRTLGKCFYECLK